MTFTQITPFVPCTSLDKQIDFYCACLGFELRYRAEGYAFLKRDAAALRLVEVWKDVDLHHPERQTSFYIDVTGIDALYESLRPALENLPQGRVRPPFQQPYGQREFHVTDEDCTLIYFGETTPSSAGA